MLLLFAGGVMNLWTIAVLTAFVLFEKLAPFADRTRQLSAVGLLAAATWMIMH
jgi:predicted metal-binding membrane protein